jgi:hypothetical protein
MLSFLLVRERLKEVNPMLVHLSRLYNFLMFQSL